LARKLNVEAKVLLKEQGLNPRNFLRLYKDSQSYIFLEVKTGKKLVMRI